MSAAHHGNELHRRTFLKGVAAGVVTTAAMGGAALEALAREEPATEGMPKRVLGRTGVPVSVVAYGGGGLRPESARMLAVAVERGVNFIDVARNYGGGQAELGVGEFLKSGADREKLFINTKASRFTPPQGTSKAVYEAFKAVLTESLQRMKTDYVDCLMWPHGASSPEQLTDPRMREAFEKLREEKLVRFFGTSSHSNYPATLQAAVDGGFYDVILTVVNICTQNQDRAGDVAPPPGGRRRSGRGILDTRALLERAKEKNVGVMAMKVANGGFLGEKTDELLAEAFPGASTLSRHQKLYTYGLGLPGVSTVVIGIRNATHLKEALALRA